jgi:hypothetical protein
MFYNGETMERSKESRLTIGKEKQREEAELEDSGGQKE